LKAIMAALMGRLGVWKEGHRSGNPMNRELVSEYLAGYERYVFDELDYYSKIGAVPV
jgi:hypothetical protein